jgi:alpha-tubulin suppressor-like RCC1 family protein
VPIHWSTADPSVATIDASAGLVTGIAPGTTTIAATGGGSTAFVTVTVRSPTTGGAPPLAPLMFSSLGTVGNYACGIEAKSAFAYCWGDNHSASLGSGDGPGSDDPVRVGAGAARRFASISVGFYTNCAIETGTELAYCWGSNRFGQVGDGTSGSWAVRSAPTLVAGGSRRFSTISTSGTVTCGVEAATSLGYCWGEAGLIGDGTLSQRSIPTLVGSGERRRFGSISVGRGVACGVELETGLGYCWGSNRGGLLGDGTTEDRLIPTVIGDGRVRFSTLSASDAVVCGIEAGTRLGYCWGPNEFGQVGDGSRMERLGPALVGQGALRFSSISAGSTMVCAVEADTDVGFCWGRNRNGSLGDGTLSDRSMPVALGGGLHFASITAGGAGGGFEACGVEALTGLGYCWGHMRLVPAALGASTAPSVVVALGRKSPNRSDSFGLR